MIVRTTTRPISLPDPLDPFYRAGNNERNTMSTNQQERDELAQVIHSRICEESLDDCLEWRGKCVKAAEETLAAGYSRPRQVTTVEELRALPLPAIIDSPAGGPARVEYYAGPGKQQRYIEPLFCEDDEGGDECYSPEYFATFGLPATVLFSPVVAG